MQSKDFQKSSFLTKWSTPRRMGTETGRSPELSAQPVHLSSELQIQWKSLSLNTGGKPLRKMSGISLWHAHTCTQRTSNTEDFQTLFKTSHEKYTSNKVSVYILMLGMLALFCFILFPNVHMKHRYVFYFILIPFFLNMLVAIYWVVGIMFPIPYREPQFKNTVQQVLYMLNNIHSFIIISWILLTSHFIRNLQKRGMGVVMHAFSLSTQR